MLAFEVAMEADEQDDQRDANEGRAERAADVLEMVLNVVARTSVA